MAVFGWMGCVILFVSKLDKPPLQGARASALLDGDLDCPAMHEALHLLGGEQVTDTLGDPTLFNIGYLVEGHLRVNGQGFSVHC